jgi:hypothetical protein
MQRCKSLVALERVTIREVKGLVVFSQTKQTAYGSCLELRLKHVDRDIWWQEQANIPAFIKSGDTIRGFYTSNSSQIVLDAYELLDENDNVLTRSCKRGYEFQD